MPGRALGQAFFLIGRGNGPARAAAQAIRAQAHKVICINDDAGDFDFDVERENLRAAFEAILPQRSAFER